MSLSVAAKPSLQSGAQDLGFEMFVVNSFDNLSAEVQETGIKTYQLAFSAPPYFESFQPDEVRSIFHRLSQNILIFGILKGKVISLAGGYVSGDGRAFFVDELAVTPSEQKKGYGSKTLNEMLRQADQQYPQVTSKELRTSDSEENRGVVELYQRRGFHPQNGPECVVHRRTDGTVGLDTRAYYSTVKISDAQRLSLLHRVAIVRTQTGTSALIFDQLFGPDCSEKLRRNVKGSWRDPKNPVKQCGIVTYPTKGSGAVARVVMLDKPFDWVSVAQATVLLLTQGKEQEEDAKVHDCCGEIEITPDHRVSFQITESKITLSMDRVVSRCDTAAVTVLQDGELAVKQAAGPTEQAAQAHKKTRA